MAHQRANRPRNASVRQRRRTRPPALTGHTGRRGYQPYLEVASPQCCGERLMERHIASVIRTSRAIDTLLSRTGEAELVAATAGVGRASGDHLVHVLARHRVREEPALSEVAAKI